jgi:lysyl-tRNA synthetase class 2
MVYYNEQMTQTVRTMNYRIMPEVFQLFPDFYRGVVVAGNAKNGPSDPEILSSLLGLEEKIKNEHLDLASDPRLKIWEDAYVKFGSNPKKYTPSINFLVSRIKEGKSIRSISTIVDLFNIVSLRYLVPCGGDDVDTVEGDLTLGIATGKEIFAPLFKPDAVEHPSPGEVIFFNQKSGRVFCRRWTWRNADFSKITEQTNNLIINVDGLGPAVPRERIVAATAELTGLLQKYCGATSRAHILDCGNPAMEFVLSS